MFQLQMDITLLNQLLQWLRHLTYRRLPSHLGKLNKLFCTQFGVSYLDILDRWRYKCLILQLFVQLLLSCLSVATSYLIDINKIVFL